MEQSKYRIHRRWRLVVSLLLLLFPAATAQGGEHAAFPTVTWQDIQIFKQHKRNGTLYDSDYNNVTQGTINQRQDLCERYRRVQAGDLQLRHALQGLELRPFVYVDAFFRYTPAAGIDPDNPGMLALMMDELGRRAGFTWRHSFAALEGLPPRPSDAPADESVSFTDLLEWTIHHYDVSVSWWNQISERLALGAKFQTPWFDSSIILVQKKPAPVPPDNTIQIWNWLRPFHAYVWYAVVATILVSGAAYQWLEYLSGHGHGRTPGQWLVDNVYLSAISFPQNYEFEPRSAGARIFGISISIWALVMTGTCRIVLCDTVIVLE